VTTDYYFSKHAISAGLSDEKERRLAVTNQRYHGRSLEEWLLGRRVDGLAASGTSVDGGGVLIWCRHTSCYVGGQATWWVRRLVGRSLSGYVIDTNQGRLTSHCPTTAIRRADLPVKLTERN